MKKFENVMADVRPKDIEIDEYSVYVNENIKETDVVETVQGDEGEMEITRIQYVFDQTIYGKDEYILYLSEQQKAESLATSMAIAQITESIVGGGM